MSLGLGILLSTILLMVVWQIDKRNAWRSAGKASLWLLAVVAVAGVGAYGYFGWWPNLRAQRANEAEIAQARNPTNLPYWGIRLGMSKAQVRYLKGEPSETKPADKDGSVERWIYRLGEPPLDYSYSYYWDDNGVFAMDCQGDEASECERIVGLGPGSSEENVRTVLGKPDRDEPPKETGVKGLGYGTGRDKLLVVLTQGRVKFIAVTRNAKVNSK